MIIVCPLPDADCGTPIFFWPRSVTQAGPGGSSSGSCALSVYMYLEECDVFLCLMFRHVSSIVVRVPLLLNVLAKKIWNWRTSGQNVGLEGACVFLQNFALMNYCLFEFTLVLFHMLTCPYVFFF